MAGPRPNQGFDPCRPTAYRCADGSPVHLYRRFWANRHRRDASFRRVWRPRVYQIGPLGVMRREMSHPRRTRRRKRHAPNRAEPPSHSQQSRSETESCALAPNASPAKGREHRVWSRIRNLELKPRFRELKGRPRAKRLRRPAAVIMAGLAGFGVIVDHVAGGLGILDHFSQSSSQNEAAYRASIGGLCDQLNLANGRFLTALTATEAAQISSANSLAAEDSAVSTAWGQASGSVKDGLYDFDNLPVPSAYAALARTTSADWGSLYSLVADITREAKSATSSSGLLAAATRMQTTGPAVMKRFDQRNGDLLKLGGGNCHLNALSTQPNVRLRTTSSDPAYALNAIAQGAYANRGSRAPERPSRGNQAGGKTAMSAHTRTAAIATTRTSHTSPGIRAVAKPARAALAAKATTSSTETLPADATSAPGLAAVGSATTSRATRSDRSARRASKPNARDPNHGGISGGHHGRTPQWGLPVNPPVGGY